MSFVYPAFLYSLFALAIPIIIHLFKFRKFRKIYFTNVRFLKEIKQESKSKSRLKHLLVLATRLLALSFLVFAFSQPYLPTEEGALKAAPGSIQTISIFVDNSFSMDAVNDNGRLIEQAKAAAREISHGYSPTDRFQVITNDFEGRHQRLVQRDELQTLIDEIDISPSSRNISEIIARQLEATRDINREIQGKRTFFIFSDFQQSIGDFNNIKPDSNVIIRLIPVQSQTRSNLYIDSCWFASPVRKKNRPDELHIRLINASESDFDNVPVRLTINGQVKAIGTSISIPAHSALDTILNFTITGSGFQNGYAEITDYPITFDDKYYFSFRIAEEIRMINLYSGDSSTILQNLFSREEAFSLQQVPLGRIDYSTFPEKNLILLTGADTIPSGLAAEIKKFVENGGSLAIFPPADINFFSYREFLTQLNSNYYESLDTTSTRIDQINLEHILFENVFENKSDKKLTENIDLPVVNKHYRISRLTQSQEEWLLKTRDGNSFLSRYPSGKGYLYLAAVPLRDEYSNFSKHAIFVPTLYQIALHSQATGKISYTIGRDSHLEIIAPRLQGSRENIFHFTSSDKNIDLIPETRAAGSRLQLFIHNQALTSGNYFITLGVDTLAVAAYNYDRKESDIRLLSDTDIDKELRKYTLPNISVMKEDLKLIGKKAGEISEGIRLWKYCIILALMFLVTETVLLRWWK